MAVSRFNAVAVSSLVIVGSSFPQRGISLSHTKSSLKAKLGDLRMDQKIAQALAADVRRRGSNGGTVEFHDDEAVYTVTVTVERPLTKSFRESRGGVLSMSGGGAGSPCDCCNGTGRKQ